MIGIPVIGLIILFGLVMGYRLIHLQMQVASYRSYWDKQAAQQLAPGDFVYVALGDSTAQAIGASHPLKGYVGIVADYVLEKTGKNVHIINLSVSGAKLRDVLDSQLDQLKDIPKIDLVTIEIGSNDVPLFQDSTFAMEFQELVARLPKDTIVSDVPCFKGGLKAKLRDRSKQAADIAAAAIDAQDDLHLAHLFEKTDEQGLRDFAADLFHPSNKGYQNWATAFIDAIDNAHLL